MKRIFLYYPTIMIPKAEWLHNVLLYTDKVSSILPNNFEINLPDQLKYLMDEDEYSPVYINDILTKYSTKFRKFEKKFLQAIDRKDFLEINSAQSHDARFEGIYKDKMTPWILQELKNRGLIMFDAHKFYMHENIAIYYMSVLAQFVATVSNTRDIIIPSTDYKRFSDMTFVNKNKNSEAINLIFDNCLPVPDTSNSLKEIIKFKQSHKDELLRFRQFVGQISSQINNARDNKDVNEILISTKEKIELELSTLNKIYRKSKIKQVFTTMDSLFSLENPKLFESLMAAGMLSTVIDPKIGIFFGALVIGAKLVTSYMESSENLKTNELNYLFEAKRSGLLE